MSGIESAVARGRTDWRTAALTAAWRHTVGRSVHRHLTWKEGVRIVAIGGATLGGSGKTPLSIACAAELAAAGFETALVGHAYKAFPGRPRVVSESDSVIEVGDEALVAVGALASSTARVVVAPTRALAVAFAAETAEMIVIDGLSQTKPARASLALLALDGAEPWGRACKLPPLGDLRAPLATLIGACDGIVPIVDGADSGLHIDDAHHPIWPARVRSKGAWLDPTTLLTWDTLRSVRVGLLTAVSRPDRVRRALARRGIFPEVIVNGPDHGPLPPSRSLRAAKSVDLWLVTPKCATHASDATDPGGVRPGVHGVPLGAPMARLDYSVVLSPFLCARLRALGAP